jgi:hypothetical protein
MLSLRRDSDVLGQGHREDHMPFRLTLFRADDGLGPMFKWEREHREPLGTRDEVQAALERVLPQGRWEASSAMVFGSSAYDGEGHAVEITLFGQSDGTVLDIAVYARPPAIRAIMSGLRLNYCYAQDSGELYFPFQAGEDWPAAVP